MSKAIELYGVSTRRVQPVDYPSVAAAQHCPFLGRKCVKVRKSEPDKTIGTCTVLYGRPAQPVIICPYRLLEQQQVFLDCLHLLNRHEPGNQLHVVREISIPGGNVDYFLVSAQGSKVVDFVGIELQTLDTTGTVWPERQRLLKEPGATYDADMGRSKGYGMNWKMTAKTILIQLHHKVQTFQSFDRHMVLVIQDVFMEYVKRQFRFDHIRDARPNHSLHIHVYQLDQRDEGDYRLSLVSRLGTDADGVATALDLQVSPVVALEMMVSQLEAKISDATRFVPTAFSRP